jgi:hypothetical protein
LPSAALGGWEMVRSFCPECTSASVDTRVDVGSRDAGNVNGVRLHSNVTSNTHTTTRRQSDGIIHNKLDKKRSSSNAVHQEDNMSVAMTHCSKQSMTSTVSKNRVSSRSMPIPPPPRRVNSKQSNQLTRNQEPKLKLGQPQQSNTLYKFKSSNEAETTLFNLKEGSFLSVKRTNGDWTCAMLHSFRASDSGNSDEESVVVILDNRRSKKMIGKSKWRSCIRLCLCNLVCEVKLNTFDERADQLMMHPPHHNTTQGSLRRIVSMDSVVPINDRVTPRGNTQVDTMPNNLDLSNRSSDKDSFQASSPTTAAVNFANIGSPLVNLTAKHFIGSRRERMRPRRQSSNMSLNKSAPNIMVNSSSPHSLLNESVRENVSEGREFRLRGVDP